MHTTKLVLAAMTALAISGCARRGDIVEGGISQVRSACPAVGIPAGTGDITTFNPADSRLASAIEVEAAITNMRRTCNEGGSEIVTVVTFDVVASRRNWATAQQVTLPYYTAVVQGGNAVVSKRIGQVVLDFPAGQPTARAAITAGANVNTSAATLPADVREQITRRRRAGEQDAAVDPLSVPSVRAAVLRATFEVLIGFQLTPEQLRYNATR